MPLVAWAVVAYVAGLVAGYALEPRPAIAAALILAAVGIASWSARVGQTAALAILAAGALLIAQADTRRDERCSRRLAAARRFDFRPDAPADVGDVARGRVSVGACSRRGILLVEQGQAAPGRVADVRGMPSVDARGVFVRDARLGESRRDGLLAMLRARTGLRIDRLFARDAPMVRALVIGDMSAIASDERDRYARSGLVHMLSVSGLHVGIIAVALELLAMVARLPRTPARIATISLLAVYVAAIGAPPPAVRAAVMLGVLLATRMLQRPTSPWAILALGSAAPLATPRTVLDLGWQLSVAGTAALVAGGLLAHRIVPRGWRRLPRALAMGMLVSVVATLATAPLVAWTFGRVALVGPVTNLLADPVMAVLQPLLFLALCVPVPLVEGVTVDAAHGLLALFDAVARAGAAVPGGAPSVTPTAAGALLGAGAVVSMLVACSSERASRPAQWSLGFVALLLVEPIARPTPAWTELHMLDVGQGDAIAMRTRAGRWILVDAGRSWRGGDAGRSTVVPYLTRRGGSLALFVLSHPHADHVGGAATTFDALRPDRFLDPGYVGTTPSYRAALASAASEGIPWQRVRPGDSLVVDEVVLTALAPDSAWAASLDDANLASAVIVARVGRVRVLLTGDAEAEEEAWLLARDPALLAADVLKVAHHGSRTSSTASFLAAVRPRLALVSVGAHNAYGHPDAGVMRSLRAAGAAVLRTDHAGTIVVRTDGSRLDVEAGGERWTVPERHDP